MTNVPFVAARPADTSIMAEEVALLVEPFSADQFKVTLTNLSNVVIRKIVSLTPNPGKVADFADFKSASKVV